MPEYPPEWDDEFVEEKMGGPEEVEAAEDREEADYQTRLYYRRQDRGY